jgi:2-phosphosulfolactate phosphatase
MEVLFSPAGFRALGERDLGGTVCVVIDVLRATSAIVTALANGAAAVFPGEEIAEALEWRRAHPGVLLAGERDGLRIDAALTGGVEFDLGNSPREFTAEKVAGKTIVATTTNGTRALRACAGAKTVVAGSFLNLAATALFVAAQPPADLLLVCAGTGSGAALEDAIAAGALCELLIPKRAALEALDSAEIARSVYRQAQPDVGEAVRRSQNARRLLARVALREDVAFCLRQDCVALVALLGPDGAIRKCGV